MSESIGKIYSIIFKIYIMIGIIIAAKVIFMNKAKVKHS